MTTPIPAEQTELLSLSAVSKSPKPVEDDATDALEVQAWELLHQINADSGWEATVVRGADSVAVQALVANNTRKEEFDAAFRAYPKVVLSLHECDNPGTSGGFLPHRDFDEGGAPPLAGMFPQRSPDSRAVHGRSASTRGRWGTLLPR